MIAVMALPAHASLNAALEKAGSSLDPSECHGLVCGVLSLDGEAPPVLWINEISRDLEAGDALASELLSMVEALGEETRRQIHDPALGFQLLLPDENDPLPKRVDAMRRWSSGYGFGLAIAGLKDPASLNEDGAEIVRDITEFARVSIDDGESEENEIAYAEVVEYLRMGVLLIHAQARKPSAQSTGNQTRH
ncbi:MAG: UPF0149 family protein [Pseudomonadota bacterium]|nr:UPF0149 family protein [Pseudomonadota bacterium]